MRTDSDVLGIVRTLFALERNYLAEERTYLAEFRTGLSLAVIGAPLSTFVAYILPGITTKRNLFFEIMLLITLGIVIVTGIVMIIRSRRKIQRINSEMEKLQIKINEIIKTSNLVDEVFADLVIYVGETEFQPEFLQRFE